MLHSKAFEYPFLYLLESVVVLVQDLLSLVDIAVYPAGLVPRKVEYGLDVSSRHVGIRAHRAHLGELVDLLADLSVGLLFKLQLVELLPPLARLVVEVLVLAKLFLDDLQLLPEVILPLAAVHVLDDTVVDPLRDREDVVLLAEDVDQLAYTKLDRVYLEQGLLDVVSYVHLVRDEAAEKSRIIDIVDERPSRGLALARELKILHVELPQDPDVCLQADVVRIVVVILYCHVIAAEHIAVFINIVDPYPLLHDNKNADVLLILLHDLPYPDERTRHVAVVLLRLAD